MIGYSKSAVTRNAHGRSQARLKADPEHRTSDLVGRAISSSEALTEGAIPTIYELLSATQQHQHDLSLRKLAGIAKIPHSNFSIFAEPFESTLRTACVLGRNWRVGTPSDVKQLDQLEATATAHAKVLAALNPAVGAILNSVKIRPQEAASEARRQAVAANLLRTSIQQMVEPNKGGRPSRRFTHGKLPPAFSALDVFVWSTLTHVNKAGGRLVVDKNYGCGTLVDFLVEVRRMGLLPEGLIPDELPIFGIAAVKSDWTKKVMKGRPIGPIKA